MPTSPHPSRSTRRLGRGGGALLLALVLTACTNTADAGLTFPSFAPVLSPSAAATPSASLPSSSLTAVPSPSPTTKQSEQARVLAAYNAYNDLQTPLSRMPVDERPTVLATVATDPLYSAVLKELAIRDAAGKVGYGKPGISPVVDLISGRGAVISDCLDTSTSGVMDAKTGKKLTVGVPEVKTQSTLELGDDGAWRLATRARTVSGKC